MHTCTIDPVLFTDLFLFYFYFYFYFYFLPVFRTRPGTPPCPPTPSGGTPGSTPTTQQVNIRVYSCPERNWRRHWYPCRILYPCVPAGRLDALALSWWRESREPKIHDTVLYWGALLFSQRFFSAMSPTRVPGRNSHPRTFLTASRRANNLVNDLIFFA